MKAKSYEEAMEKAYAVALAEKRAISTPVSPASTALIALGASTPERRRSRLRSLARRWRNPHAIQTILNHVHVFGPGDQEAAADLLALVEDLLGELPGTLAVPKLALDLRARTCALRGNLKRLEGDLLGAGRCFEEAFAMLEGSSGDIESTARVHDLFASFARDRRDLESSVKSARTAVRLYQSIGLEHEAGRCLLNLASSERIRRRFQSAVRAYQAALVALDFSREPQLERSDVLSSYALCLAEAGQVATALDLLRECPASALKDARHRALGRWREGLIYREAGEFSRAAGALREAADWFREHEDAHNLALCSLDLAILFAARGEHKVVLELAHRAFEIFKALLIPQAALNSWILFVRAAESEQATSSLIRAVIETLTDRRPWSERPSVC